MNIFSKYVVDKWHIVTHIRKIASMYLQRPWIKSKSVHNDQKSSLVLYHIRNYTIPLTNNFIDDIIRKMMMPQQCYSNINVLTYFIAVISSSPVYMYDDTIYCDITVLNKPFMDVIFFKSSSLI